MWLLVLGSFLALVAGQDSHVSVLVDQLNYGVLKPSDLERLSPALAQAFAHALGITPEDIQDAAGHLSEVDLHPGTTRNQYMPDTWPLAQPGTGTVVSARARLPSTNLAFIAEDTLGGGLFESKLRKVVGDVLGHDSEAILGQLAVDAAVVHEDVAGRDDPAATQAQPRDKGAKLLWYVGMGVVALILVGMLLCCVRSCCARKNLSGESTGFLQVNTYEDDVPIYKDPMKLFSSGQGH
ncbi:unnamed protein product [Effrenium voratum]|uniref:Uncharacterized protein n=1 Tax=Effrenium voratum TaxID=2562239 RepID=A0AA36IZQ4_9DINO|nr:unnamed protein product [Effrenium voratum]CAJ1417728.1 unnamed protein product [Effrenium voratum]